MNPVLLKPGSDRPHQVMVLGSRSPRPTRGPTASLKPRLAGTALASLTSLADRFDVVICEGAGSPAEINLRDHDLANMGLARAADLPVIVVADIDRGGVLAAPLRHAGGAEPGRSGAGGRVRGEQVPRRCPGLLDPGLAMLPRPTGRPVLGVLPWRDGLWLDVEDSLGPAGTRAGGRRWAAPVGAGTCCGSR